MKPTTENTCIIIPAFNEEESIGALLDEIKRDAPWYPVVVISDGSHDRTAEVAGKHGAKVLDLPCNIGVGGAVQAGFSYAFEQGFQYAVRCDGDGQHPPSEIPHLVDAITESGADMVIGSRFLNKKSYRSTWFRFCGIKGLALFISLICRNKVTDPTSGFQIINRPLLCMFSRFYPTDYPEPEALAFIRRQGYSFSEVAVVFRERQAGQSTIRTWGTFYYLFKVFLALLVDRARPIDHHYSRKSLEYLLS